MTQRRVAGFYRGRALAEEAAARLAGAGFARDTIQIAEEAPPAGAEPGVFDRLARLLAPEGQSVERGLVVAVSAPLEQVDAAAIALEAGADRVEIAPPPRIAEHVIELSETAEELIVRTEPVLVEEIVMRVQAREHIEEIQDTVRRTEVEVERFGPDGTRTRTDAR
jgi:hypothetical protein